MSYYQALGLVREPFSNSPDPDLLYRSKNHLECLQHMEIAVRLRRGLNVVLGEVGTGKTTLGRELMRILLQDPDLEVYFLDDPYFPDIEAFLVALARLFGLDVSGMERDQGRLKDVIKAALLRRGGDGRRIVTLIVDEGQKITGDCLELLRELLNFETNTHKLLQIVMFAQLELDAVLTARPNLDDRVNFRYELRPLGRQQTRRMIEARLNLCAPDGQGPRLFTNLAFRRIHRLTGGYPRKIVRLCHMAMLLAVGMGHRRVDWGLVGRAAREMRGLAAGAWRRRLAMAAAFGALAGTLVVTGLGIESMRHQPREQAALDLPVPQAVGPALPSGAAVAPGLDTPAAGAERLPAEPVAGPVAQAPDATRPTAPVSQTQAAIPAGPVEQPVAPLVAEASPPPVLPEVRGQAAMPPVREQVAAALPASAVLPEAATSATPGDRPSLARAHGAQPPRPVETASVADEPSPGAVSAVAAVPDTRPAATAPQVPTVVEAPAAQSPDRGARKPAIVLVDAAKAKFEDEQVIVVTANPSEAALSSPVVLGEAVTRPGWTVSRQALWVYGNPGRSILGRLAKANPGVDFDRIRAGQTVIFPAIEASPPPRGTRVLSLGPVESLEKGMAWLGTMPETPLPLVLFVTHQPGKGICIEVVAYALYDDAGMAAAALGTLPPALAAKAHLVEHFPQGTVFYTDLAASLGRRSPQKPALPAQTRRQVAVTETR